MAVPTVSFVRHCAGAMQMLVLTMAALGTRVAGGAPVDADFAVTVPWQRPVHSVSGTNWEGRGVQPDVVATAEEAPARAMEWLRRGMPVSAGCRPADSSSPP